MISTFKIRNMKRFVWILLILLPIFANAQNFVHSTPRWFKNPPTQKHKVYGTGTASASDMKTAEQKALLNAKLQVAKQVGTVEFSETKKNGSTTKKESVVAELKEVKIVNRAFRKKRGRYISYVLIEVDKRKQSR